MIHDTIDEAIAEYETTGGVIFYRPEDPILDAMFDVVYPHELEAECKGDMNDDEFDAYLRAEFRRSMSYADMTQDEMDYFLEAAFRK